MVSRAARQRTLLHQRKYPDPDFSAGTFHREALNAIQRYLTDGAIDERSLENALQSLLQQTHSKIGARRRRDSNIERLETFLEMLDHIDLQDAEVEEGPTTGRMTISSVSVSIRPEVVLRGHGQKGRSLIGAIKLHMSASSNYFNEEAAGYVSAAVQEFCKRSLISESEVVHAPYCQVIDVGGGRVYPGVKATRQRMKDIQAACQNISALWPSI